MIDIVKSFSVLALELTILFFVISFVIHMLQAFIPYEKIEKRMTGNNRMGASMVAIVFAFITPFCSCSTIPIVVNLLKNKIPFSIVMVFLFASPVLDPTIITVMGVVMGWEIAGLYTLITAICSIIIGFTLDHFGFEKYVKRVTMTGFNSSTSTFNWSEAWNETWQLMKNVYPYLIIGAAIGSLIHGVVPTEWIVTWFGHDAWWLIPIAAVIGIPLYIRLSSMIPISQVLIMKGMALGPVMAMMISSAGASLPEIVLMKSIFRKELIIAFILSVLSMSMISGIMFYFV